MRLCTCRTPHENTVNPRHAGTCVICGFRIPPEWGTENIRPLLDRLEYALGGEAWDHANRRRRPEWDTFRRQCEAREKAGRERFGHRYLGRSNEVDALEENADYTNYMLFGILKRRREGRDEHLDVALEGARSAFHAYKRAEEVRQKEHGTP